MEAKVIVLRIKVKESCTDDLNLVADAISNNIIYDDGFDSLGFPTEEAANIEEITWEIEDGSIEVGEDSKEG